MSEKNQLETLQSLLEKQKTTFEQTCKDIFGLSVQYGMSDVKELTTEETQQLPPQFILVELQYTGKLSGNQYLLLSENDAKTIYGTVMGIESPEEVADEELGDGLANFFHQTYGETTNQLADELDEDIQLEFPKVNMGGTPAQLPSAGFILPVEISGLKESKVNYSSIYNNELVDSYAELPSTDPVSNEHEPADEIPAEEVVTAHSVDFQAFSRNANGKDGNGDVTLDLLMNIELPITVELGRTDMYIKDILGLHKGSIIELNKLSGDPVDLYVNNKKFAEGEVVIIDENFGVRITQLLNTAERLGTIKEG